jgi:hypothetical protein
MKVCIPKRLNGICNYLYCVAMTVGSLCCDRKVFILLDPSQPSIINAVLVIYG